MCCNSLIFNIFYLYLNLSKNLKKFQIIFKNYLKFKDYYFVQTDL